VRPPLSDSQLFREGICKSGNRLRRRLPSVRRNKSRLWGNVFVGEWRSVPLLADGLLDHAEGRAREGVIFRLAW